MNLEQDWVEAIPEFKISEPSRRLLSYLFRFGGRGIWWDHGGKEARRMGWVERVGDDRYVLTDFGRTVCRQLGIGGAP
jgi:hypothetical protein